MRLLRLGLPLVGISLAVLFVVLRLEVVTDITHFLPDGTDQRLGRLSRAVANSPITKTMVLSIGADDRERAREAARQLAIALGKSPRVAWVRSGLEPGTEQALREIYYPRRFALAALEPEERAFLLSDEGLAARARELKRQLALPTGGFARAIAPEDPLLAFMGVLERLKRARASDLTLDAGQLVTADRERAIIFVGSRAPPFDSAEQAELQEEVTRLFEALRADDSGDLVLEQSGAARFAVASERSIKSDITRISVVGTIGIILLFLALLRSPRSLLLVGLPLAAGIALAAATGLALFGRLHGLTLAFGATLIGVCIDYAVHLLIHHSVAPDPAGPDGTLRRIWPALTLGALTTVAGLLGLAWTSLPGIREIAVFAASGVLAALLTTALLLPPLLPRAPKPIRAQQRAAEALGRLVQGMAARRRLLALLPLSAILVSAITLPRLRWVDDITALNELDPLLLAEDQRVRDQVSQMESGRFVVAIGRDEEAALRSNDAVYVRLAKAVEAGEVEGFQSVHPLLPSAEIQHESWQAFTEAPRLFDRTMDALRSQGFRTEAFEPFRRALDEEPAPLRYEELAMSPLADFVRPFRVVMGDEVAFLTFLRGVRDPRALSRRLAGLDDVLYFDQLSFLSSTYGHCRARTLQLMVVGLVAVFLMVLLRYRRLSLTVAAFAPALLAATTTLGLLAAAGVETNLLHLVGLLLVLSMGVDYGVFMVESRSSAGELQASTLSLVIACLSTVFAFGLLGMSSNPALRAIGLTTGLGVLLSVLLAPTAFVLLASRGSMKGRDEHQ